MTVVACEQVLVLTVNSANKKLLAALNQVSGELFSQEQDCYYAGIVLPDSICACLENDVSEIVPDEGKLKVVSREVMDRSLFVLISKVYTVNT